MITITICEDHQLVREGLIEMVEKFGFKVNSAVDSGEALLSSVLKNKPDVILLDISLPGRSGLDTLKNIMSFYPDMNVIALSMYPENQYALRMLKSGARAYLNKDCNPETLKSAIVTAAKGEEFVSPELAKVLLSSIHKQNVESPHENLSDREYEVFLALGKGIPLGKLGEKLNLSVKTVSTYKTRVFEKMNVKSTSEIIKYITNKELSLEKAL